MARRKSGSTQRFRVGKVSVFLHHGTWWLYYGEGRKRIRRKVSSSRKQAEEVAAQVNSQLVQGAPTLLSFQPLSVPQLRRQFLDFHEQVLKSSIGTLCRYRAATQHLESFASQQPRPLQAHEVRADAFAAYLRQIEVAPNGHPNTRKRRLRDKGVLFILETCRAMYSYAIKRRHLPPYVGNPFSELPLDRLKIEDAKPIFVFTADTELAFFQEASDWSFPLHFTLAKTGLRVGELIHLLIEDLDLEGGWLHVRNKTELGWRVKTGNQRDVPLLAEVVAVLRVVIGRRESGPVFLREKLTSPVLVGSRQTLERILQERIADRRAAGDPLRREEIQRLARRVWSDAGAVRAERLRQAFLRIMEKLNRPEASCPKSWRHSFATLLQDANVDPLIRQQVLGHQPTDRTGLGMTAKYTHTRPETLRQQVEQALRRWPASLEYGLQRARRYQREG
jgi:integrase